MNYSFRDFVTDFLDKSLPASLAAIAASPRPISLRAVMAQAAPYPPDTSLFGLVDNSNDPAEVAFFWADDANLPPWYQSSANPARQATSWRFQLWETANNTSVIDTTVTLNAVVVEEAGGRVQYDYVGALDGDYYVEITAFNDYGSSSTGKMSVNISLPFNPKLGVTRAASNSNSFVLKGTGFPASASVSFEVDGGVTYTHSLSPPPASVAADQNGNFTTATFSCQSLCTTVDGGLGGGGSLRFEAKVDGVVVASVTSSCVAT